MTRDDLRQIRQRLGMTQPELAQAIKYGLDTVKSYETGRRTITTRAARAIRNLAKKAAK